MRILIFIFLMVISFNAFSFSVDNYLQKFRLALQINNKDFYKCYRIWKRGSNSEDERINTLISVKPDGAVDHIGFPDTTNHNMARCIAKIIYKTTLPKTGIRNIIKIGQPLSFQYL